MHGDRDEHFYGDDPPEEGQNLIKIESGRNIIIDGVKIVDGSKGGMNINSLGFTFNSDYKPSHNIVVKNCVFENNRRMGMSITDGFDIIIENNKFINSGQPSSYVDGGVVGYALNIEGVRTRDQNTGQLVYYERPHNIIVRGNYERGSRVGGITISSGDNVLVENNDMENKIVYSATSDSEIRNNKLISSSKSSESPAIIAGGRGESVFNNEISGNVIEGYGVGIVAYYDDVRVLNNIINECGTGIQLKEITNSTISNNKINSTVSISRGIMAHLTSANNVSVSNNEINVVVDAFYLVELNRGSGQDNFKLNVSENIINSTNGKITFSNINGLNFESNVIGSGIQMVNVSRIDLQSNKVVNTKGNGISLRESNVNVVIAGNDILIPLNYECIKNTSTSQTGVNIDTSNICTNN